MSTTSPSTGGGGGTPRSPSLNHAGNHQQEDKSVVGNRRIGILPITNFLDSVWVRTRKLRMELYRIKFIMERRMVSSSGEKLVVVLVEVAPAPVSSYGKDGYQEEWSLLKLRS
jgi:hypothetical protein